ncbi:MAG: DUF72 domain-containing protein [Acidobacteriota bacterium]
MTLPQTGPIHCGPSGWAHPQWQGLFYPASRSKDFHQLAFAARFFNTVELTSSFFSPLRSEHSRLWSYQVRSNPAFQFTARAWRKLTFEASPAPQEISAFREGLRPLEEAGKLVAVLLQFTTAFRFMAENRTRFLHLRRELRSLPLVAEFRHASWMEEDALALLIDSHTGFCNIDQPDHARAMPPTAFLTSPIAYTRLCGRTFSGPYRYTSEDLEDWAQRIRKSSRHARRSFVVLANGAGPHTLVNTFQMKSLLGLATVRAPHELVRRFPGELGAFRPDRPLQAGLFDTVAA